MLGLSQGVNELEVINSNPTVENVLPLADPTADGSSEDVPVIPPPGASYRRLRLSGARGRGSGSSSSARSSSARSSEGLNSGRLVIFTYRSTSALIPFSYAYPTLGDVARVFRSTFPELVTRDFYIQVSMRQLLGGMAYIPDDSALRMYLDLLSRSVYPALYISEDILVPESPGLCRADYC
ncbi:hypothetical protein OROHE_008171 [Orobanche hederae]